MNLCKRISDRGFHTCSILRREKPKNLKGKKHSSQIWLARHIRDPYVEMAKQENYRCRSAFKLIEINDRFGLLQPGMTVVDCGASPGSWTQVAVKQTNADGKNIDEERKGFVVAIDRLPIHPINGAVVLGNLDFTAVDAEQHLRTALDGRPVDLVMSDMAPNATGVKDMDHENIIKLCYLAMKFCLQISRVDGHFLCKVWDGGLTKQLETDLQRFFKSVKVVRPAATRDESTELFLLSRGFKGIKTS